MWPPWEIISKRQRNNMGRSCLCRAKYWDKLIYRVLTCMLILGKVKPTCKVICLGASLLKFVVNIIGFRGGGMYDSPSIMRWLQPHWIMSMHYMPTHSGSRPANYTYHFNCVFRLRIPNFVCQLAIRFRLNSDTMRHNLI